jgi:hypothetical protein
LFLKSVCYISFVLKFVGKTKILGLLLQQKKREMVASAFGEDENGGRQTRLTVDDLNYLFMV